MSACERRAARPKREGEALEKTPAALGFLRYLEWQAFVVGTAYLIELAEGGLLQFAKDYNLFSFGVKDIGDAVNLHCVYVPGDRGGATAREAGLTQDGTLC